VRFLEISMYLLLSNMNFVRFIKFEMMHVQFSMTEYINQISCPINITTTLKWKTQRGFYLKLCWYTVFNVRRTPIMVCVWILFEIF